MSVAYLIQSHRDPEQLYRLVRRLRQGSPQAVIHVSHDRRGEPVDLTELHMAGATDWSLDRGGYGDWTHVQRYLDTVRWLRDSKHEVGWVTNLTAQDYPLRPVAAIEADLAASTADGFMEFFDMFSADSHWPERRARGRYLYRHVRISPLPPALARRARPLMTVNRLQPLLRVHTAYGLTVGVPSLDVPASARRYRDPAPAPRETMRLYGGSAYSTLTWPTAMRLLELAGDRDLINLFHRTLSPEEAFAQTVLMNYTEARLVNDARRYWDFTGTQGNHPRVLGAADLPAALASGADFGRKFADPAVLDRIDALVDSS